MRLIHHAMVLVVASYSESFCFVLWLSRVLICVSTVRTSAIVKVTAITQCERGRNQTQAYPWPPHDRYRLSIVALSFSLRLIDSVSIAVQKFANLEGYLLQMHGDGTSSTWRILRQKRSPKHESSCDSIARTVTPTHPRTLCLYVPLAARSSRRWRQQRHRRRGSKSGE